MKEYYPSADRPKAQVSTSIVQELKSKFEAEQRGPQHPQNGQERADLKNQRQIPGVQKTVAAPRVQYIDKVLDIPVDVQRQVSAVHAAQQGTQHENKKTKTLFVNIASGDEAEDESEKEPVVARCLVQGGESMLMDQTDAQGPEHEMVQVMHAEWVPELRDVKNERADACPRQEFWCRRERSAETKAEIATRKLNRMEKERDQESEADCEATLEEALADQSKVVKVIVDKWFR